MTKLDRLLENTLIAQVNIEEGLLRQVQLQLSHANIDRYPDVKEILSNIKNVLEDHFIHLNRELDQLADSQVRIIDCSENNASDDSISSGNVKSEAKLNQFSQMLQDDYAALNLAAMGTALLHSTAVAANRKKIADLALEHLSNMTRFVFKLNDVMPKVVIKELGS